MKSLIINNNCVIVLLEQQQSEEQRAKMRGEMERKRVEAYEKEKRLVGAYQRPHSAAQIADQQQSRPQQPSARDLKPETAVNVTEVLSAIGIVGKKM